MGERSLPTAIVDLIRDGVPMSDLRAHGPRLYLGRTAHAAVNCGWTEAQWADLVMAPKSMLGQQLKSDGRRARTTREVEKDLSGAWRRAAERVAASPAWTSAQAAREAELRAVGLRSLAEDADLDLTSNCGELLRAVADQAVEVGAVTLALPRATADRAGIGEKAVAIGLKRLAGVGVLKQTERGRTNSRGHAPRANVFRLGDDANLALARMMLRDADRGTAAGADTRMIVREQPAVRSAPAEGSGGVGSVAIGEVTPAVRPCRRRCSMLGRTSPARGRQRCRYAH